MCNKCDEEIKAAIDHVVVAALKLARLTGMDYRVSALQGLMFTVLPIYTGVKTSGDATVAVVRASSTAAELKNQISDYMVSLVERDPEGHASSKMEFVDRTDEATTTSTGIN